MSPNQVLWWRHFLPVCSLVDGQTVTHGHAPAHPSGAVGLRFEGEGIVAIERVEIVQIGTP